MTTPIQAGILLPQRHGTSLGRRIVAGFAAWVLMAAPVYAQNQRDSLLRLFAQEANGDRRVEGRLSGDWPFVGYQEVVSTPRHLSDAALLSFARSAAEIRTRASSTALPEDIHALGVLQLLSGKTKDAVLTLEEASRRKANDAQVLNDLGVALVELARLSGSPIHLMQAVSAFETALTLDALPCVTFNLAIALSKLHLNEQARNEFGTFAQLEQDPLWVSEASYRADELGVLPTYQQWEAAKKTLHQFESALQPTFLHDVVPRFSQQIREFVSEELLPAWAISLQLRRNDEARARLALARELGVALLRSTGDRLIASALDEIDRAAADTVRLGRLASGHIFYGRGIVLYRDSDIRGARELFERAAAEFTDGASPFALQTSLYLAICDNYENHYPEALARLAALKQRVPQGAYPSLNGRIVWIEGFAQLVQAKSAEALRSFEEALTQFLKVGDTQNASFIRVLIATTLDFMGQGEESWKLRLQALRGAALCEPRAQAAIFADAAELARQHGFPHVALRFLDGALAQASELDDSRALADAFWRKAAIHLSLDQLDYARNDLETAKVHAIVLRDPSVRELVSANIALTEAQLLRESDPRRAITLLTQALERSSRTDSGYFLTDIFLSRARAFLAHGDVDAAERDLESGIEEAEKQRVRVSGATMKASFMEKVDDLLSEMVLLQAARGDAARSLTFAEQRRARGLLDELSNSVTSGRANGNEAHGGQSYPASVLAERIPHSVALVEFFLHERRSLAWVIAEGGVRLIDLPASSAEIHRATRQLRALIEEEALEGRVFDPSGTLYDWLIRPVLPFAPQEASLVLVPDNVLTELPFSALVDRDTGDHLVESRLITSAPSASLYAEAQELLNESTRRTSSSILVVANPAFDLDAFESLPRLPAAEHSAPEIASFYESAEILLSQEATTRRFLAEGPEHEVIHFAGHAVISPERPLMSQLVLAPTAEDSGRLLASEIMAQRFLQTKLVVLAACRSGGTALDFTEGVGGLGRAFLAAGVPTIVGSLWDLEDEESATFFVRMHRLMRSGLDSAEAVRAVQLEFLNGDDAARRLPRVWATFLHVGVPYNERLAYRGKQGM